VRGARPVRPATPRYGPLAAPDHGQPVRSTSPAPGRCGPRAPSGDEQEQSAPPPEAISDQLLDRTARARPRAPRGRCPPLRCSSTRPGEIGEIPRPTPAEPSTSRPAGAGLDRLRPALEEMERMSPRNPRPRPGACAPPRSPVRRRPEERFLGRSSAPPTRKRSPSPAPATRRRVRARRRPPGWALLAIGLQPGRREGWRTRSRKCSGSAPGDAKNRPCAPLPGGPGELLVESEQGPWIVREDGSKRPARRLRCGELVAPTASTFAVADGAASLAAVDTSGTRPLDLPGAGRRARPRSGRAMRAGHENRLPKRRRPCG